MKTPAPLQKGDIVALASPARFIEEEILKIAEKVFNQYGLQLRMDADLLARHHQFAGNDQHRAAHFQRLLNDDTVKAIVCSRGGYGSLRLIDQLDFSHFSRHPKWIAGYSDITVFHAHLQQVLGIKSLHSTMPVNFENNSIDSITSLMDCLSGNKPSYAVDPHPMNIAGIASGELIGGNLSILYSLVGSQSFPDMRGKILFIEDVDEYLYHLDRMLVSLKRAGVFRQLAGLVVGGLTQMNDNTVPFGNTAESIVLEHVAEYRFPVCMGFPAGHLNDNRCLIMGGAARLEINQTQSTLSML